MRIVVSDTSFLIDLRKVELLETLLRLPYEFLIPNTLFDQELVKFSAAQKKTLLRGGLKVIDLPGERVSRAQTVIREKPHLSVHDAFAFVLAESHKGCILLSGNEALRTFAVENAIEVHGILWLIDELFRNKLVSAAIARDALKSLAGDVSVRLPKRELAYLKRYEALA